MYPTLYWSSQPNKKGYVNATFYLHKPKIDENICSKIHYLPLKIIKYHFSKSDLLTIKKLNLKANRDFCFNFKIKAIPSKSNQS